MQTLVSQVEFQIEKKYNGTPKQKVENPCFKILQSIS